MRPLISSDASSSLNSLDDAKFLAKRLAIVLSISGASSCSASSLYHDYEMLYYDHSRRKREFAKSNTSCVYDS